MQSSEVNELARQLVQQCTDQGLQVTTAESCTGGLIAAAITDVPGASESFTRGYVTYGNEAKSEMLDVPEQLFATFGAVSEEVARAMAEGALRRAGADLALSATGIAGPGGATANKPVGLVHVGAARREGEPLHERHVFAGDRTAVRQQSVAAALKLALKLIA